MPMVLWLDVDCIMTSCFMLLIVPSKGQKLSAMKVKLDWMDKIITIKNLTMIKLAQTLVNKGEINLYYFLLLELNKL